MNDPKRLRLKHLRLIIALAVDLLTLSEDLINSLGFLRPLFLQDRRFDTAHYIGDRRLSWLERLEIATGIEPPHDKRTLRINILVVVATVQVSLIILATARVRPETILLIPVFCLYSAAMLTYRQYRLNNMESQG
jgi:hypothetical protein